MSPFLKFSKDPSLQAESSDPESNLSCARCLVADSAVIKGSAVMLNADLVSYKIPMCVLTKVDSRCRRKNVRMGLDSF